MKVFLIYISFLLLSAATHSLTWAQGSSSVLQSPEYQQRLRNLNERYEDFFHQQAEDRRWHERRRQGMAQLKTERTQREKSYEQARQDYIRKRQTAPDLSHLEREWERQREQELKAHEQARQKYVQKIEALRRIERSAKNIPEEDELKLYWED